MKRARREPELSGRPYVGAPKSPMRPGFKYVIRIASWQSAWLFPLPIGPENPLNLAREE